LKRNGSRNVRTTRPRFEIGAYCTSTDAERIVPKRLL